MTKNNLYLTIIYLNKVICGHKIQINIVLIQVFIEHNTSISTLQLAEESKRLMMWLTGANNIILSQTVWQLTIRERQHKKIL